MSLNKKILCGAIVGVTGGLLLNVLGPNIPVYSPIIYTCEILGKGIFINLLKMIIIPLVFTSIVVGIANLRAHAQMDRVWKCSLIYFLSTTALAILLGMIVVNIFKPGIGLEVAMFQESMTNFGMETLSLSAFTKKFIFNLFVNPFQAMATGQILPTIIFAIFLGIALIMIGGEKAQLILKLLNEFFDLIMIIVGWVMQLLPFGLMALLIEMFATQDPSLLKALGKFMFVVIGATLFHGIVTLPVVLRVITKVSPKSFFKCMQDALVTAFSTSSSSATLPITLRCVKNNLKVNKDVAGFVLPLGATINMDGTALYEAVAAIFVANLMGIELNLVQQLVVFFTAMIAAIGAPGIPSAGLVTMMMVLQSVGLPVEAVAILIPIDRLLDAIRTTVNVEGDAIGSMVVQKFTSPPPIAYTHRDE